MCWTNLPFLISGLVVKDNKSGNLFFEHLPYYQKNYTCWKARHWQRNIVAQHSWEIYHWLVLYNFSSIQGIYFLYIYVYIHICETAYCAYCAHMCLNVPHFILLFLSRRPCCLRCLQDLGRSCQSRQSMLHHSPNAFMCFTCFIILQTCSCVLSSKFFLGWR